MIKTVFEFTLRNTVYFLCGILVVLLKVLEYLHRVLPLHSLLFLWDIYLLLIIDILVKVLEIIVIILIIKII